MRFGNYNEEKKDKTRSDIYIKGLFLGVVLALFFIAGGITIKFLIEFIINYWMWIIGVVFLLVFLKRILLGKKKR